MSTTDVAGTTVLDEVKRLVPTLRENAHASEERRWILDENIELLDKAGVFRAAVPVRFGGLGLPLADQNEIIREISRGCASTGWVAMVWLSTAWMATLYPDRAQEEIFRGGSVRVSGGFTPGGTLTPTEGGYVLNGTWRFNTGSHGADWNMTAAHLLGPDGEITGESVALVPMASMSVADDWHVAGAAATGSSTSTAKDLFVPAHLVVDAEAAVLGTTGDRSNTGADGRNYGIYTLVMTEAAAGFLGIAQAALELFLDRVPGRGIAYTNWTDQSAHPLTQIQVATAANKIAAAEALIGRVTALLQRRADAGEHPTWDEKAAVRGNTAYAVQLAKEAVEVLYTASGASVIALSAPLQRLHRDIQALSQHGLMQITTNLEVHGRVLLGLDPDTPFL
ncbi:acyl-CoA dehydrogenase family protein [Streptomyces sp. NPDC005805]|uniref:acyl-CoA dehydrogenase family protein n=1 Tax=Streptomyces sp. NPDC005805 TaxID=3157068 RepID=UPI0033E6647F